MCPPTIKELLRIFGRGSCGFFGRGSCGFFGRGSCGFFGRGGQRRIGAVFDDGGRVVGVIGVDHVGYLFADFFVVVIGRLHEVRQLFKELVLIKGNGAADVDELVLGLLQALFGHELLLIELLAGAEAGVFDFDIHVGLEAGEADQVAGQGVDLDRGTHVEDKDLSPVGIGAGQHDETDGLGNGHEVADDIRVGHGHGAAFGDLLAEERNDRTVGAQDVAEAHGDELGPDVLQGLGDVLTAVGLIPQVGEEAGQLGGFSGLDLRVEGLDDHLTDALAGAHDIRGVHGLVGGDQDKALTAVNHGGIGGLIGAEGVVLNRLTGAVLHEGDMLMGRSVINDLRPVIGKDLKHPSAVADGADEGHEVQVREGILQLVLDVIGVVLIDIEDDELLRVMGRDLAAELGADGPAAARDQDGLAAEEVINLLHLGADHLPA